MVCAIVKAAISLDSKDRADWASAYDQGGRLKTKLDSEHAERSDVPCKLGSCNMRTVIVTEEVAGAALRISSGAPRRLGNSEKRSNSSSDSVPWFILGRKLQSFVLLCLGILVCSTFIFALCTVDARATQGKSGKWTFSQGNDIPYVLSNEARYENAPHGRGDRWKHEAAFRGLGVIFRKGTRSMDELIVANVEEYCNMQDFRLFLRTLHRSGATARADLVLLFPWVSIPKHVADVVWEEEQNFRKLITKDLSSSQRTESGYKYVDSLGGNANISTFNALAFERASSTNFERASRRNGNRTSSILWGNNTVSEEREGLGWGSIVGFEMNELDPDNFFSEFLRNPSSQLRRWLCYQMLLGVLRRKFKRAMLVELGEVVILGDAFTPVRKGDGLYLTLEDRTWADPIVESHHHEQQDLDKDTGGSNSQQLEMFNSSGDRVEFANRKIKSKGGTLATRMSRSTGSKKKATQSSIMEVVYGKELWDSLEKVERERQVVCSGVILGSMRAVKGLATSMVIEIVSVALHRKSSSKQHAFPDRALLSYLVQKSSILGRKVTQNLRTEGHKDSVVHWVNEKSMQSDMFFRSGDGKTYAVVLGARGEGDHDYTGAGNYRSFLGDSIIADICADANVLYEDCRHNNR